MKNQSLSATGFIDMYDHMILATEMRAMYGDSGFYNVGNWTTNPATLDAACRELVIKHLDQVEKHSNPMKILDAGCGLGGGSGVIARRFSEAHVVAINVSEKQVLFAQQRFPGIDFKVMDATKMNFPDDYFDLIISVEAVFHFDTRIDFLQNAFRLLRPGGQLVFSDILFNNTDWVGKWSVPEANLITDIKDYTKLCTDAGFKVMNCVDITTSSIKGFCNYLRNVLNMTTLADGLEHSVKTYLLVSLKK